MIKQPYRSEHLKEPTLVPKEDGIQKETLFPYFADEDLQKAVNLAILLNRPLLLMGEPGCGKSLLAKAVAYEWYKDGMYTKKKYYEWNVKSTSKAKEGIYEFDHLLRLQDANLKRKNLKNHNQYRRFGPLALGMYNSSIDEKAIVLIDEIDKADIDFSNDLLNELERNSFSIPETGERRDFDPNAKPFIVITSNGEKDLSDAFLRRCIFHYIDMFSPARVDTEATQDWLHNIIRARFYRRNLPAAEEAIIEKAVLTFVKIRKRMNDEATSYRKSVNTSEFIDWFSAIKQSRENGSGSELANDKQLLDWLDANTENPIPIPFGNILFKTTSALLNFKSI